MKTWLIGVLFILLTITLVSYNIYTQKESSLHEAHTNITYLVNLVETDLTRTFASLDQIFMGMGNHLVPYQSGQQIDAPEIRRMIDTLVLQNQFLNNLMILDENGRVLYWNSNYQKPDLSQQNFFQIHKTGNLQGLYFGPLQSSIINKGLRAAVISKAIQKDSQSPGLVLVAIIDLNYFENQYRPFIASVGTTLSISTLEGFPYTHISSDEPDLQKSLRNNQNTEGSQATGQTLSSSKKVSNYPLTITISKDREIVMAAWKHNSLRLAVVGLLACLIVLLTTWRAARNERRQRIITEKMRDCAGTDLLTSLFNRARILKMIKIEMKRARREALPLSIILMELDHFEAINQNYGQKMGDQILADTARTICECSRESDILGRYTGDTFLLLLPDTDLKGTLVLSRKIQSCLTAKNYAHKRGEIQITASFGISEWASEEKELHSMLDRAGSALSEGKKRGGNNIRWVPKSIGQNEIKSGVVWLHSKGRDYS